MADNDFNFEDDVVPLRGTHFTTTRPESGVPLNRFQLRAQTREAMESAAIHRERIGLRQQHGELKLAEQRYEGYKVSLEREREEMRIAKESNERVPQLVDALAPALNKDASSEERAQAYAQATLDNPRAAATPAGRALLGGAIVSINAKASSENSERQKAADDERRVMEYAQTYSMHGMTGEIQKLIDKYPQYSFAPFLDATLRQEASAGQQQYESQLEAKERGETLDRAFLKDSYEAMEGFRLINQPKPGETGMMGEELKPTLNPGDINKFVAEAQALAKRGYLGRVTPEILAQWVEEADAAGAETNSPASYSALHASVLGAMREQMAPRKAQAQDNYSKGGSVFAPK